MTSTSRPYTGNKIKPTRGKDPGMEYLVRALLKYGDGTFQNWGTYQIRKKKGLSGVSVHARGTAADLGYNKTRKKDADNWINLLLAYADELGIEAVLDYNPKPHGRGWRCDRNKWMTYTKRTIVGAPGGNWYHLEIRPGQKKMDLQREFHKMLDDLNAALEAFYASATKPSE
jgi:hypothetical protein